RRRAVHRRRPRAGHARADVEPEQLERPGRGRRPRRRAAIAVEVIMPALGMAQETGKLLRWIRAEGDEVAKGEPLMEIETDKVTVEIEAPAAGTLAGVTAAEGDDVPVGHQIALILAAGEPLPQLVAP